MKKVFLAISLLTTNFIFTKKHNLIEVKKVIPNILLDIKYATKDNFTKEVVYNSNKCYLLQPVTEALKLASKEFNKLGYKVKIWDGYRPLSAQYKFWKLVPDSRYVADPKYGSRHNRGCAVDLTLVDKNNKELDMGTEFDNFTEKAHRSYKNLSQKVLKNRKLLEEVMAKYDFIGLPTEWWHFDYKNWKESPILDIAIEKI